MASRAEPQASHTASRARLGRPRLDARSELALAALPTLLVLAVFAVLERFTHQRLLFASLASSAFLIYLDPQHSSNQTRTFAIAVGMVAILVVIERSTLWQLARADRRRRRSLA